MLNLDKSSWQRVRFGDVVRNVNETVRDVPNSGIENLIALEHLAPGEITITRHGSVADGTTFTRRVRPGQTLFGKRRAYQRKAAYAEVDAICSGDILVFQADEGQMSPRLLPFLVQSDPFFDHALGTSAGSLSPRTNWKALANFEFDLPPLDEQDRIADLLWAVEEHRRALSGEKLRQTEVLDSFLVDTMATIPEMRRLGELATIRSGPSFSADNVSRVPVSGSTPVLGIPNTKPDGTVNLAEVGYVKGLPTKTPLIDESSLVVIRTNGNRQRIGNVYIPPSEAYGFAVSAFQFLMRIHDPADREFLYWAMRNPSMQAAMSEAASGTTGLGNLASGWLQAAEVPWPSASLRSKTVARLAILVVAADALDEELQTLANVRETLLARIFGGAS